MENKTKKKGLLERITSSRVFRVMFSRKIIVVCAILLLIMVLIAIFAPVIAPYDPNKDDLYNVLKGCSAEHWLGTDSNGRDVLSRIIYGARISFTVGIVAVVISSVIGMALGLIAGMAGGVVDAFIMRVMDAMMAVPMLLKDGSVGVIELERAERPFDEGEERVASALLCRFPIPHSRPHVFCTTIFGIAMALLRARRDSRAAALRAISQ